MSEPVRIEPTIKSEVSSKESGQGNALFTSTSAGDCPVLDAGHVPIVNPQADYYVEPEIFKVNLYNCHCHQIFLGCSHDNGYARLLEETLADLELTGRISLIEGVPFERELDSIKASYRVTQFPGLFRNSKISNTSTRGAPKTQMAAPSVLSPKQGSSLTRTSTNTTSSSSSTPASWSSWASVTALHPGDITLQPPKPADPAPSSNTVPRNKYGQRIDQFEFKTIPKEDLNRIKKMKLCNLHFLLGDCPNTNCHHDHTHPLTKNERVVLQAVARMTPCRFGLECDEPKCIYGHRCPQSEVGRKDCYWGSSCRFEPSQHGIDTTVVKVTKV
jgi:hypothetical protein